MNVKWSSVGYVAAAIVMVLGIVSLVQPALIAGLFGLEAVEPRGLSQIRATFGGMYLALGGTILVGMTRPATRPATLAIPAVLVAAVVVGRIVSLAVDHSLGLLNMVFLFGELAAVAGIVTALLARNETVKTDLPF